MACHFLWGSKRERLKREVIKKKPENGGKGLPDPHLFLGSKFVALHMNYAKDPSRDSKTSAMVKFWMGSYLRKLKILKIDLTKPVAFNLSRQYAFIEKFLKKYGLEKEDKTILTNAKHLVSSVQDREKVSPGPGLTLGEAKRVWRNAAHPALPNKQKDLSWMAAHKILLVRAVMHSRGMAKDPICPRPGCGAPETVRHVFWECSVARELWALTGPLECPSLPAGKAHPLDYRLAVNGVGRSINKIPAAKFTALWLTLNSVKAALWTSCDLLVGKRVTVSLHALGKLVKSSLQGTSHGDIGRRGPGTHVGGPDHHGPWRLQMHPNKRKTWMEQQAQGEDIRWAPKWQRCDMGTVGWGLLDMGSRRSCTNEVVRYSFYLVLIWFYISWVSSYPSIHCWFLFMSSF